MVVESKDVSLVDVQPFPCSITTSWNQRIQPMKTNPMTSPLQSSYLGQSSQTQRSLCQHDDVGQALIPQICHDSFHQVGARWQRGEGEMSAAHQHGSPTLRTGCRWDTRQQGEGGRREGEGRGGRRSGPHSTIVFISLVCGMKTKLQEAAERGESEELQQLLDSVSPWCHTPPQHPSYSPRQHLLIERDLQCITQLLQCFSQICGQQARISTMMMGSP